MRAEQRRKHGLAVECVIRRHLDLYAWQGDDFDAYDVEHTETGWPAFDPYEIKSCVHRLDVGGEERPRRGRFHVYEKQVERVERHDGRVIFVVRPRDCRVESWDDLVAVWIDENPREIVTSWHDDRGPRGRRAVVSWRSALDDARDRGDAIAPNGMDEVLPCSG